VGLSEAEIQRYARHIILGEVGGRGQIRLRGASVLLLGLGGIGCSAAAYLAAAGVGHLGIADPRPVGSAPQSGAILFAAAEAAAIRTTAAAVPLQALNPHARIECLPGPGWLAPGVAGGWDVVLAAAGDWAAWAAVPGAPLLLAGAAEEQGALAWLEPGPAGPAVLAALQAAAPALAPEAAAVFAAVAGVVGSAAATEVIKRILGIGTPLAGVLRYDGAAGSFTPA